MQGFQTFAVISTKLIKRLKMKQTLITALLLTCTSMQAQNVSSRHEIGVSYGYPTIAFGMFVDSNRNCSYVEDGFYCNDKDFGPLSVEYYYRFTPLISAGGVFTLIDRRKDIVDNKTKVGDYNERYYAAMPAIKFNWARGEFITLFSKLALGPCLHNKTDKIYLQAQRFGNTVSPVYDVTEEHSSSHLGLLGQITLLGIEIGSRINVFGELGIGAQGVCNVGLRYKF